ncbi:MAG: calcium/sodium antiporter [Planctomycetota bacterium]|jgi:cation:H+ antiporter
MSTVSAILLLAVGLVILWKAADFLVKGAVALAERLGVSPLVIGLTVVAMGTSAPEVAASIAAVFQPAGGDMALGNVFGSNIANLALVGGLAALIRPLIVQRRVLLRELPVMLLVALLLWPLLRDLNVSLLEGILLLALFTVLILLTIYTARREPGPQATPLLELGPDLDKIPKPKSLKLDIVFVLIGLVGLAVGAKMTVAGAVFIGRSVGLSEAVIGLTIIAIGTSLPELATCLVAAVKGQHDISIGNLVGSNIFNTLLVTGAAGAVRPFNVSPSLAGGSDYGIMIAVSVAFALLAIVGRRTIGRFSGALLLAAYLTYIIYLLACGT